MSVEKPDNREPAPPRETGVLYGHGEAEQALLGAYRSSRFPHAWLIAGPAGIGKATLAYRMARFMLAHPDPRAPLVQNAKSLQVPADHPAACRIAAQAHSDLLVLERTINEKTGKLRQDIQVDDVRRTVAFFGSTPGEGGWRVAIVDAVDELNESGANALLKILEEPPRRAVLLLVSRSAARVLPTMRSRCRSLVLRPLRSGVMPMLPKSWPRAPLRTEAWAARWRFSIVTHSTCAIVLCACLRFCQASIHARCTRSATVSTGSIQHRWRLLSTR